MYKIKPEIHIQAVKYYLNNGATLMETAKKFNVHYQSVFKWVKKYKNGEKEGLYSFYRRPWNRTRKELEEKIALLKEKDPTLTVRKAKEILEKKGVKISIKGIWGIWKRYGYAGFKKENISHDFTEYCSWSKEAEIKYKIAKRIFEQGNTLSHYPSLIKSFKDKSKEGGNTGSQHSQDTPLKEENLKECAKILNPIPCLPKPASEQGNELLLKIPDNLLNLRRKIEKIHYLFGKIPIHTYLKKIEDLYQECKRKSLNYSALRIGLTGVMALEWKGKPKEQLKRIEELKKIIKRKGNYYSYLLFEPKFTLFIEQGIAYSFLSKINLAQNCANLCKKLLKRRKNPSPYLMNDLGVLYTNIDDYKSAEYWFLKSSNNVDEETKRKIKYHLGLVLLNKGEYKKAKEISRDACFGDWSTDAFKFLFYSLLFLLKGEPQKAISLCNNAISVLKKEELGIGIFNSSFITSASYCGIGEKTKARKLLKRLLLFFKKKKFKKYKRIIETILSPEIRKGDKEMLPCLKIVFLLKKGEYFKALSLAKKKGIMSHFYRYIFFFPELVINFLEKCKKIYLPKAILKLPVFNKNVLVYEVKFLGKLIVHRSVRREKGGVRGDRFVKEYIRQNLSPKESAFLIALALRASEPGKEIPLDEIYKNFWPRKFSHPPLSSPINEEDKWIYEQEEIDKEEWEDPFNKRKTYEDILVEDFLKKEEKNEYFSPSPNPFNEGSGKEEKSYKQGGNITRPFGKNPARNLSHLLVRIKKALKMPSHLLEISYKENYPVLKNKGIYFTTDYFEFEQTLAQANAFLRADEWKFAKKEFIRAFNLMRGEPFKKMYDNWSENMRTRILYKLEKEVLKYSRQYIEYKVQGKEKKDYEILKKVLEKAKRMIPYSTKDIEETIERIKMLDA